jgi:hypothetical protein
MRIAPPNSLVLVMDPCGGDIPASINQSLISATGSCIVVGCRAEDDGETEIRLGLSSSVDPGEKPVFEGRLETVSRKIAVKTVHGATLLEMAVAAATTDIRIWANDAAEPDRIIVGVG